MINKGESQEVQDIQRMKINAAPPEKSLQIFVLGRFEIAQGQERLIKSEQWLSRRACSLFKVMLSRRNYQISRQEAAELLWPELDSDRASNNLHQALYSLRRTLEPGLEKASSSLYLKSEGSQLQLNPALINWIDLQEFQRLHRQARLTPDISLYEQAAELYAGDYLPEDLYEDWSVYQREALRQEWVELLLALATLYQNQGQEEKYQQCLYRVLESDFSHEESLQKLMRTLAETGRRDESLTLYHNFATKLESRLNLEPLHETRQLQQAIIAEWSTVSRQASFAKRQPSIVNNSVSALSRQALARPSFGLETLSSTSSALSNPSLVSPQASVFLVGRKVEQQTWQESLQKVLAGKIGSRLSLLSGEAGIGKTHLLERLAEQAREAGFAVLTVRCSLEQAVLPFSSICNLVEQAASTLEVAELEACFKHCGPGLLRLLPGLALKLSAVSLNWSNVVPLTVGADDGLDKSLFVDITHVLTWLNRRQPLVLVLDDLHYLPEPSVQLLGYLLTHPSLTRFLVLGAFRPLAIDLTQPGELNHLLNWAGDGSPPMGTVHRLSRFQPNELARLIAYHFGDRSLDECRLLTLNRVSRGNPRVALELVAGWRKEGRLRLGEQSWRLGEQQWWLGEQLWDGQLPTTLLTYIRRIVGELSQPSQILLQLAALIGPGFSFEILRQIVLHRSDGAGWWIGLDKNGLGQALTEVSSSGLIEESGAEYYFVYPLLAETLVAGLPHGQKQCWREVIDWARQRVGHILVPLEN